MKLTAFVRSKGKKSELTKIRNAGDIPSVFYGPNQPSKSIFLKGSDFQEILRKITPGQLATQIFDLSLEGKDYKALIKEIQYHRTTYQIEHVDFEMVTDPVPVTVNASISCKNVVECVGVKKGGMLRQILRKVKVSCLLKNMPSSFEVDVAEMEIGQNKKLKDIFFPEGVTPIANLEEVVVAVSKR